MDSPATQLSRVSHRPIMLCAGVIRFNPVTLIDSSRGPLSHEQCSPACTSYDGARKDDVMKLQLMTPTHLR